MDKRLKQLNSLRSFESAARNQSYSKAAEELFVTQAAISQQMRQLESSLGVRLFTRSGRRMKLTSSGEKLFKETQLAFDILTKGLNSIQCEQIAGDLTITSTQAFTALWFMPRLYRFSKRYPEINIKVLSSNNIEDLSSGHIDLAIRFALKDIASSDHMHYEFVGEDHVYPVCSAQLAQKINFKQPRDLLKSWLVKLSNQGAIDWPTWFEHVGVSDYEKEIKYTEVSTGDMALSAVLNGHGVTLASQALFSQYLDTKQLVLPFKKRHPISFKRYIAYDANSAKIARLEVFINWLKEEFELEKSITTF